MRTLDERRERATPRLKDGLEDPRLRGLSPAPTCSHFREESRYKAALNWLKVMARIVEMRASGGIWTRYAKHQRNRHLLAYANEFLQASLRTGSPLVRAHLLGHAVELLLKTYLLSTGAGETQMRKLGHHLDRILAKSRSAGLDKLVHISAETEQELQEFSRVYGSHAFRYFSILHLLAPPRLPTSKRVQRLAQVLKRALAAHLRAA